MDGLTHAFRQIEDALDEQLNEIRLFRHSCARLDGDCLEIGDTLHRFDGALSEVGHAVRRLRRSQDGLAASVSQAA